jgi:uncharacterized membrane protein
MPTWREYMELAFDEIRQSGTTSIRVMRRLKSALARLAETVHTDARRNLVRQYLEHLNSTVDLSKFDGAGRIKTLQEARQGQIRQAETTQR